MTAKRLHKSKPKEAPKAKRHQGSSGPKGKKKQRRPTQNMAGTVSHCASGESNTSKATSWLLCQEALISPPSRTELNKKEKIPAAGWICPYCCSETAPAPSDEKSVGVEHEKPTLGRERSSSVYSWENHEVDVDKSDLSEVSYFCPEKEEELFHFLFASKFYQHSSSTPSPSISSMTSHECNKDFFCGGIRMNKLIPISPVQLSGRNNNSTLAALSRNNIAHSIEPDLIDDYQIPPLVSFRCTPKKIVTSSYSFFSSTPMYSSLRHKQTMLLFSPLIGKERKIHISAAVKQFIL